MKVSNHILHLDADQPCPFAQTPNFGKVITPLYLVLHYTAGTTAAGAIGWFQKPQSQASAHFVLDRDGGLTQMVPMNRRAWHAGESRWGELKDINSFSIGIEIVNAGKLRKRADGAWVNWSNAVIRNDEVSLATHKNEARETGWHEYTSAQIETVVAVGTVVAKHYQLVDVLGHDDIAPARKADPGPLFPMSSVRSRILGRQA